MKFYLSTSISILSLLLVTYTKAQNTTNNTFVASESIVIAELFTAQGCSSCPPADRLIANYILAADKRILPLSFHVDYWNRLGWKDPFSQHIFSERQQEYATNFRSNSVYTPQLVLNGTYEVNGSNKAAVEQRLTSLSKTQNHSLLSAKLIKDKNIVKLNYTNSSDGKFRLEIALVEQMVTTKILRGENEGLTLTNYNIVRNLITVNNVQTMGDVELSLPSTINPANAIVVAFLQHKSSLVISNVVQLNWIK